ncbi:MAG: hypothetical protein GY758_12625 [Fuerstiella sp.]|jgi:hypothetical protein|nr:hypothetical protein [Fuerstiella sp.]MCP4506587.1 hypothetical protein [Fuerstiella sp.]MDG2126404.1 hypothetical protein [Fuerstiella sp.]
MLLTSGIHNQTGIGRLESSTKTWFLHDRITGSRLSVIFLVTCLIFGLPVCLKVGGQITGPRGLRRHSVRIYDESVTALMKHLAQQS